MHIPDGFINAGTSLGAGAAAAGGLGVALRRSAQAMEERQAPLAGLVAAFVFAAQTLNFPVAAGTSGHLIGGVLAGVLIGPWAGSICIAVVLLVQTLFADGGLTALGLNVLNMALIPAWGGYAIFALVRRVTPARRGSIAAAAGIAAALSVVLAAIAFVVEYALGGAGGASLVTVAAAMVGVHVLIGVGEGVITAATIGTVLSVRPDLVHGAAGLVDAQPLATRAQVAEGS